MSEPVQARTVEEIRATGAAWVTESELSRLCDAAARLAEAEKGVPERVSVWHDEREKAEDRAEAAKADRDRYRDALEWIDKFRTRLILGGFSHIATRVSRALDPEQP